MADPGRRSPPVSSPVDRTASRSNQVFVYGDTMRGGLYGGLLSRGREVRLMGPARCRGTLYDLGSQAALVAQGRAWVAGELYRSKEIDRTLELLDSLGPALPFRRRIGTVRWKHGETLAWIRFYEGDLSGARRVPGGSWRAWLRSQPGERGA
jgi:gamma-glutamylcyclotransferase (GGCT)/AIG2-like uncharacterized protein YtfP